MTSSSRGRAARSSSLDGSVCTVSSIPSIPSLQVSQSVESANDYDNSQSIPTEVKIDATESANNDDGDEGHRKTTVSVDRERQMLLLFLLAQICALHDPTPRTFT